jgi:hypothetical protein
MQFTYIQRVTNLVARNGNLVTVWMRRGHVAQTNLLIGKEIAPNQTSGLRIEVIWPLQESVHEYQHLPE